jgi:hypothetical protein
MHNISLQGVELISDSKGTACVKLRFDLQDIMSNTNVVIDTTSVFTF